jgi:aryl-alcohol dehydrogenase-like predicted oxidoreductase
MPLDRYVTLGRSGLRVSPVALGSMTFGEDLGWGASARESEAVIDRYIELGGNFIDTANGYTRGHAEKIIGDHLGHNREARDRMVIATKFSTNLYPGDPNGGGSGRKSIIAACEESLRRLRTDYIDLYWLHNYDKHTPIEETVAAMHDLVKSGKVRYIGISDTPAWKAAQAQLLAEFRGWTPFVGLQIEYSLAERTVEGDLIPMAQELGLGVTPWSPLAAGRLSGKYTRENAGKVTEGRGKAMGNMLSDKHFLILDALHDIAQETDASVSQIAMAWVLTRPGVSSVITGSRTVAHLNDNLGALDVRLSPEQVSRLDEISAPTLPFPHSFLKITPALHAGGTRINGEYAEMHPLCPPTRNDAY